MPVIAVIENNRCQFDDLEKYVGPLLYENHSDDVRIRLKTNLNDYLWSLSNLMSNLLALIKMI